MKELTQIEMIQRTMQNDKENYINSTIYNDKGEILTKEEKEMFWNYLNG